MKKVTSKMFRSRKLRPARLKACVRQVVTWEPDLRDMVVKVPD